MVNVTTPIKAESRDLNFFTAPAPKRLKASICRCMKIKSLH